MEQQKVGSFLKELRREKGLTQEQLGEKLNVTGRTVSRWETGTNMPDISLLVELAEFYDVSISEIIDGERKSGKMDTEVKETVLKISDYVEEADRILKKRLLTMTFVALAGIVAYVVIKAMDLTGNVYDFISGLGLGLNVGLLISLVLYLTGTLTKITAGRLMKG